MTLADGIARQLLQPVSLPAPWADNLNHGGSCKISGRLVSTLNRVWLVGTRCSLQQQIIESAD